MGPGSSSNVNTTCIDSFPGIVFVAIEEPVEPFPFSLKFIFNPIIVPMPRWGISRNMLAIDPLRP